MPRIRRDDGGAWVTGRWHVETPVVVALLRLWVEQVQNRSDYGSDAVPSAAGKRHVSNTIAASA